MTFARRVFGLAGIYGIVTLAPLYVLEDWMNQAFPPPIAHPEHFYGFIGVALAWQLVFLAISRDPVRYRPIMLLGIVEKLSFGVAAWVLFLGGRLALVSLGPASVDLALAVLFAIAFRRSGPMQAGQATSA